MNKQSDLNVKYQAYFTKLDRKNKQGAPTQALIYSDKLNIDFKYSEGAYNRPFHIASIGKMMTACIIGILLDIKQLSLEDRITKFLHGDLLSELFEYKGIDYLDQITIGHLLSHTSGIADYFESTVYAGSSFVDQIMSEPDKLWTPQMLVDFTRNNQTAHSAPGSFYYSDTGYVLLGLIIEKVTGQQFQKVLTDLVFNPLGMNDSYLLFGGQPSKPKQPIAPIWFNGKEISTLNMLSCDWAGGGVVSTLPDLLVFQKAFWSGKIVSSDFIEIMSTISNKFRAGMFYGSGMMELRYEGFFFLLRGLPRPKGHSGILATAMFYDQTNDVHTIINLGSNKRVVDSFKALIYIAQNINRITK
ncbi:MAG: Beta-lactamase [Patescibacteria group bacterium]|nr:Beta-lactamase [Patescibacteria group bacterium]